MRSVAPSAADFVESITSSHRLESDPPGVRSLQRRIGRVVLSSLRYAYKSARWAPAVTKWLAYTKGGTATAAAVGALVGWACEHSGLFARIWRWVHG